MDEKTLPQMFFARVNKYGDKTILRAKRDKGWMDISWNEFGKKVKNFSLGLISLGIEKGNKVSILSWNRPEWVFADLGILSAGGIPVSIYASNTPKEVGYILSHSESKIIVVENDEQLKKVLQVKNELPTLEKIIVMNEGEKYDDNILNFNDMLKIGEEIDKNNSMIFEKRLNSINEDDISMIIYTSGTTGPPKGVLLTHKNILFVCKIVNKVIPINEDDSSLSFLPLAHALERIIFYLSIYSSGYINFAENINMVAQNILEVKPTVMVCVPRVFEKIYNGVIVNVENSSKIKKNVFWWSVKVGKQISELKTNKKNIPFLLYLKYRIADKLVFSKLRERLGGRLKFFGCGGAPLSSEIAKFFYSAGMPILEAYGMTECSAPATMSRLDDLKFGYVGKPIQDVEIKIADDGEILIKGPNVFKGYFKNDESTRETLIDGWLHSGDIGEFDSDGFLKITDRKKDLIINSYGKNIAPQNIENYIKINKYISQIMVCGDKKPYLTALITLNEKEITDYAKEKKIKYNSFAELVNTKEIKELVEKIIEEKNKSLAKFETIKKIRIIPQDFSQETGEMTPTMKVKRKFTSEKYKSIIEEMYKEE